MQDVFFYEAFAEEAAELRRLMPDRYSAGYTQHTIQESGDAAPPARLISIRTQSRVPHAWAPQLGGILARSTGFDHLLSYVEEVSQPPALGYLPLYCHRAVAEQALLLWLALLRRLPQQMRQFGEFRRDGLTGSECQERTLVVVGVGAIGHEVCRLGTAMGMRVLGVDVERRHQDVSYTGLDAALPEADVLVCAMDLNRSNRGYFGLEQWRTIKRGAVFVNISRGELSPSGELLKALTEGLLGGVGLDVYNHEVELSAALRLGQPTPDPEAAAAVALSKRDDCICTPHNAFNSAEAVLRKSQHSIQQIVAFLEQGAFVWTPPGAATK